MNRNTENHFSLAPQVNIGRSKFIRDFDHKTTWNTGELVPVYVDPDIVPGDTVSMKQSMLVRMMTPVAPVMDNCYMDFYWFFVPNRLVMTDWKKLMGENETAPWTQNIDVNIPQLKTNNGHRVQIEGEYYLDNTVEKGSLLNHMGIPMQTKWLYENSETETGTEPERDLRFSSLPTKAYCLIWNEFFRDENLQNPVNITKSNSDLFVQNTKCNPYITDPEAATVSLEQQGGLPCLKVCKPHDYFTSALPGAQKGPEVTVPAGGAAPLKIGEYWDSTDSKWKFYNTQSFVSKSEAVFEPNALGTGALMIRETDRNGAPDLTQGHFASAPTKLYADLTVATGATVTALRQAFAIQKFYERDARGGTRYIESIKSHFGVTNPDFRMQRPEYLGGFRQNINMNQVVQNAPVIEDSTGLGTTGAYSVTSHQNGDVFTHSFTEHGILLGLMCVRTDHTYEQGINRAWFKKKRLDFYSPEFANLSEQAILNREIYAQGTEEDEEAFGYQEAWAEMRYMPNIISGELSGDYAQSLNYWTYADNYDELPSLGNKWIKETKENVQRTLAIDTHDQFFGDFYFSPTYTRPMPLYSIPGLIDHH